MSILRVEVDLDLSSDASRASAGDIVANLVDEMERLERMIAENGVGLRYASGLVVSPLDDDELVGNWRIDS